MRINKTYSISVLLNRLRLLVLMAASLFLFGCASSSNAPIENRSQPPGKKINTHIVESGDTLYSISWRYETDYKKLAAINGIRSPYIIHKGQRIKLSGSVPAQTIATTSNSSPSTSRTPATVSTTIVPARSTSVISAPVRAPQPARPLVSSPSKAPAPKPPVSALPASVQGWNWPLNGKVVKSFGSNDLTRGITLDSSAGKDVKAAAEGIVVYSGSGVRGYGNFLILKHSDLYLSAYAYNSKLLAKEGDQVGKGQKIAVAGKDMDGKPRLYFEIRKDGKPVDPVRYLPRR